MEFNLTEEEYLTAISEACELVDIVESTPHKQFSSQDVAVKRYIAAIYDPVIPCNILDTLMCSDPQRRDLLLMLLIGRCKFGRPQHERADDMLAWGGECLKEDRLG
jgi:hypothetical protein